MEYESSYFEEKEYHYDAYGVSEAMEEKVGQPLTIEEMRKFMDNRIHVTYSEEEISLMLDPKTGLYYTDELRICCAELLINHILVDQCVMNRKKVDWQRVTNNYDYQVIDKIKSWYHKPLIWSYPADIIKDNCLVWGLVAAPGYCEDRSCMSDMMDFWDDLKLQALLWFVDHLPTKRDVRGTGLNCEYLGMPQNMPLWDRLCSREKSWDSYHYVFNEDVMQSRLDYIAEKRGGVKAAQLVRLLQKDWKDIKIHKYFNLDQLSEEDIEDFEQCLFAGMERNLQYWEQSTPMQNTDIDFDTVFSLRYRRTDDYKRLLEFLEIERNEASDGDWARYALALMDSNIFVHRPKTFKNWLPKFCGLFGREVPYQEPNKLKRSKCQKDIHVYLPDW